jgi:N-acetylglucosaminyldiphosphoundecaprenol N-acetyl-beta-D-mannosaminyltransferase
VADGVPVLWASRLLGRPIPGRAAGSDLLWGLCRTAERRGYTTYFLGSQERVLARLVRTLRRGCPGLRVAGAYSPPRCDAFPEEENERMVRGINAARPDILWVGFGAPKQELWIHANLDRLQARVVIGVGAAFDLASGSVRRAPLWMQRIGLEWFHRFLIEPRRMFRRYFLDAMPFIPLIAAQWLTERLVRRQGP